MFGIDPQAWLEQVGQWAQNEDLVKGVLITGGAALTALFTGLRVIRRKKDAQWVTATIKAPVGTSIKFEAGQDNEEAN